MSRSDLIGKYDGIGPPVAVADTLLASPTQTLEGTGGTRARSPCACLPVGSRMTQNTGPRHGRGRGT
jgi:hypothetical protein